jgi:hypothetical protein
VSDAAAPDLSSIPTADLADAKDAASGDLAHASDGGTPLVCAQYTDPNSCANAGCHLVVCNGCTPTQSSFFCTQVPVVCTELCPMPLDMD